MDLYFFKNSFSQAMNINVNKTAVILIQLDWDTKILV